MKPLVTAVYRPYWRVVARSTRADTTSPEGNLTRSLSAVSAVVYLAVQSGSGAVRPCMRNEGSAMRRCAVCRADISHRHGLAKYCSDTCAVEARRPTMLVCEECDTPFVRPNRPGAPPRYCSEEHRAAAAARKSRDYHATRREELRLLRGTEDARSVGPISITARAAQGSAASSAVMTRKAMLHTSPPPMRSDCAGAERGGPPHDWYR